LYIHYYIFLIKKVITLRIVDPQPGQIIDVRDTGSIWCKAKIIEVFKPDEEDYSKYLVDRNNFSHNQELYNYHRDKVTVIKISYIGWNKVYDEYLKINSCRVRPYGFFTGKNEFPRYANISEDSNLYYSHVINNSNSHL
jgi:hypothetical protein